MGNTNEISEEMAANIVKEFTSNTMYILLSTVKANMVHGYSFPYVQSVENVGDVISFFSSLEYAKEFIEENNFEILDGVYPLAKVEQGEEVMNFESICSIAYNLGIMYVDFNPGHPNLALGATLPWLEKQFNYDFSKVTLLINNEMKEIMEQRNDGKVPVVFNPMPIHDFKNPFAIIKERTEELDRIPLDNEDSVDKYFEAIKNLEMPELIYLSNLLNKNYIPKANSVGDKIRVDMLIAMLHVLDSVIIQHCNNNTSYTLLDGEDMFINHNQASYLIYTDRFQYMGEYRYKEVSMEGFLHRLEDNDVSYVIVTAGPGPMHITTTKAIKETLNKIR